MIYSLKNTVECLFRSLWNYLFCWFSLSNLIKSFHNPQICNTSMSRRILIFIMDRASNYTIAICPSMDVTWKGKESQWRIRFLSIGETLRLFWLINISTYMQMFFLFFLSKSYMVHKVFSMKIAINWGWTRYGKKTKRFSSFILSVKN